jgi:hypothetical protein
VRPPLAGILLLLAAAAAARANVVLDFRYGHGGQVVAGAVTPVTLSVTNRETAPVTVRLLLELPGGSDRTSAEAWIGAGATKDLTLLFRPLLFARPRIVASFDREVSVALDDRPPSRPARSIELEPPGFGSVFLAGDINVLAVGQKARLLPPTPDGVNAFALPEEHLHDLPLAYDGLDAVYWRDPAEDRPPRPEAIRALMRWVALGGRLVISATRRPEALATTGLADFLPADSGPPSPRGDYGVVARNLLDRRPVPDDGEVPDSGPIVPLVPRDSRTGPDDFLLVDRRVGFGSIAVLSFDPARFCGARGSLAAALWLALLGHPRDDPQEAMARLTGDLGARSDLPEDADALRAIAQALARDTVTPPPMGLISFLLVLYAFAVGPFDYFLLRRYRLLRFSALSLVLLALLFSAAAWFISVYLFSGPPVVNRVTLVDIAPDPTAPGSDLVRVEDFAAFYAPRGRTITFDSPEPGTLVDRFTLLSDYHGSGSSSMTVGPLSLERASSGATEARLVVPFRSMRLSRSVSIRPGEIPLSVTPRSGRASVVTNGLPYPLLDAGLFGDGGFEELHAIESATGRRPAAPPSDPAASSPSLELARHLLALTAPRYPGRHDVPDPGPAGTRLLVRCAVDRSSALRDGGLLFAAWADERDPLGLPGADESGFTITIFRKAVDP